MNRADHRLLRAALALPAALLLALGASCKRAPAGSGAPLDTVDVTAAPDAAASLEGDVVARPPAASTALAGALPESFPTDVPLPAEASLVDFGAGYAAFEVRAPLSEARAAYLARLRAAGFAATGGAGWAKGQRRIELTFAEEPGAARITIEVR